MQPASFLSPQQHTGVRRGEGSKVGGEGKWNSRYKGRWRMEGVGEGRGGNGTRKGKGGGREEGWLNEKGSRGEGREGGVGGGGVGGRESRRGEGGAASMSRCGLGNRGAGARSLGAPASGYGPAILSDEHKMVGRTKQSGARKL